MIYILPTDTCFGIACAFDDKKNYHKIYDIKKRSFEKPLAIMVESYEWLQHNTQLTEEQVESLKNSDTPFTILTQSQHIKVFLNFEEEEEGEFRNRDVYQQIGFRVANTPTQKELISKVGPIWLTSANLAGEGEIYKIADIKKQFEYYIGKGIIKIVGGEDLDPNIKPSEVFGFVGESLEKEYVRK